MLIRGHEVSFREILQSWIGIVGGFVSILAAIGVFAIWAMSHFQTAQQAAWMAYQIADGRLTVARNRVNDCAIRKEQPPPVSPLERAACEEYASDFTAATARRAEALRYAQELSR